MLTRSTTRRLLLALITALLCLPALSARAKLDDSQYTDTEKTGLAFYKFGGLRPNYRDWIYQSDAYKALSNPADKPGFIQENIARLTHGYDNYDPDVNLIHVVAEVTLIKLPDDTAAKGPDAKTKSMVVTFGNTDSTFPFQVGKLWVVIVPRDIEKHEGLSFTPEEYQDFMRKIVGGDTMGPKVTAVADLWLRPLTAETKEPSVVNGQPYWPMLADIVSFSIMNKKRTQTAWRYDMAGFGPAAEERKKLMELYAK